MFKIGMRNLKTAISVAICLLVLEIVGVKQPFFACMTAVFTMQANVSTSFKAGIARFLGTLAGAIIGTGFAAVGGLLPMENLFVRITIIPLGLIFVIHVLSLLKLRESIFVACIVYFALMMKVDEVSVMHYAISRTVLTGFGAVIALLVNRFIFPPAIATDANISNNAVTTKI